ncbi:MAG TPA: peptidyl-alpha-hydroxyglycine alpha-amidating lyase family protein [Reyranella sp.]|jgi:hypothetical protein
MADGATQADVLLGQGDWTYRPLLNWGELPPEIELGDVAAVAVDRKDRVFLFNRGSHPMIILDRDGRFLDSWGQGLFSNPHGLHIGPDDALYCTDDGDHTVRKCTMEGRVLLTIGTPKSPAPFMSGHAFCRCCHTALSPEGNIYVADGYGNARIHVFSPDGKPLFGWGEPGTGPGEFNLPHNICCDDDGWIYVADRENHRLQVFDRRGRYETQITNLHRASALAIVGRTCPICLVGEIGPYMSVNRRTPNLGPRISVMTHDGKLLARLGVTPAAGQGPGQFYSPHGIAIDSRGDLYVGEVSSRAWPSLFPGEPAPNPLRRMQKLVRVAASS